MKINRNKTQKKLKKRYAIIFVILIVLALAGLGVFYVHAHQAVHSTPSIKTASPTTPTTESQPTQDPQSKETPTNTDTPVPAKIDEQSGKTIAQMEASAEVSGDTLYIRGGINNLVVTDGSCYATLTGPDGKTITKTTELLPNASTTDCKTISIKTADLMSGTWTVSLNYTSSTAQGKSNDVTFTI
jgi:cytoskeletal protein RodZ